ncbi:hypothetical protein DTL70_19355 [Streptomyces diacarni]|uniref:Flp pilus-assembly TadG-like N-terminal domain-containing protein n=1 Tax=Streptomyces diacarni TaxID=2800381 RepID=A0A367EQU3_9ACTN|nr:hypothetical protein [Streptomyces diacarni]RCG20486.1 hypothetical protein DTL70_19355 [Streptomyces diacarni]
MIAGLLFLAFAFFAVAQAATVRNGGQTAADAAALGAARDDRDLLFDGFVDALSKEGEWRDWLDALAPLPGDGCGEAARFADRNRSDLVTCDPTTRAGDNGYTVGVETRFDTGDTFVPGADHKKAHATATAIVKSRCTAETGTGDGTEEDGAGDGSEDGAGDESEDGSEGGSGGGEIELTCDDENLTIDPDDEDLDVEPSDLFSVVLVE